jgi:inorganic triphosphatase YgiF
VRCLPFKAFLGCAILRTPDIESPEAFVEDRVVSVDRQEIEWQYDAPHGIEEVAEWLDGLEGESEESKLSVLKSYSKEIADTYYDTEDWRLYRAGYALRIRWEDANGYEATMKTLASSYDDAGNLRGWYELSEPLKSVELDALSEAPGPVGERLGSLVDARGLRPLFDVYTRLKTFGLVGSGFVRIGEVALDRSEILLGGELARLARVEVEVDPSLATIPPELEAFVETIEEALRLRPTTISKYEAGLYAFGLWPDDEK